MDSAGGAGQGYDYIKGDSGVDLEMRPFVDVFCYTVRLSSGPVHDLTIGSFESEF